MQERRQYKRNELHYYSLVYNRSTGDVIGRLGNITPHGLMIVSEEPLDIETTYELLLKLPEELVKKSTLELTAESLWCVPDFSPNVYKTGFRLFNISSEDVQVIEQMLAVYQFQS